MTTYCDRCGNELSEDEEWEGECRICGHYLEPAEDDEFDWPATGEEDIDLLDISAQAAPAQDADSEEARGDETQKGC